MKKYIFTWASPRGPAVESFDRAEHLLAWLCGWGGGVIYISPTEVRG
jgi:hypothetical protein